MTKEQSSRSIPRAIKGLLLVLLLFVAYQATMMLIRDHVDSLIEDSKGKSLPAFELPEVSGAAFSSASLKGKTAVLNFFRSQCSGCRAEEPVLKALYQRIDPQKVLLLGVMMDGVDDYFPPEVTAATLREFAYEHPVLMADQEFVDAFHGAGWKNVTPITYIADGEGRITHALRGHQQLQTFLEALPQGSLRN